MCTTAARAGELNGQHCAGGRFHAWQAAKSCRQRALEAGRQAETWRREILLQREVCCPEAARLGDEQEREAVRESSLGRAGGDRREGGVDVPPRRIARRKRRRAIGCAADVSNQPARQLGSLLTLPRRWFERECLAIL